MLYMKIYNFLFGLVVACTIFTTQAMEKPEKPKPDFSMFNDEPVSYPKESKKNKVKKHTRVKRTYKEMEEELNDQLTSSSTEKNRQRNNWAEDRAAKHNRRVREEWEKKYNKGDQ